MTVPDSRLQAIFPALCLDKVPTCCFVLALQPFSLRFVVVLHFG